MADPRHVKVQCVWFYRCAPAHELPSRAKANPRRTGQLRSADNLSAAQPQVVRALSPDLYVTGSSGLLH